MEVASDLGIITVKKIVNFKIEILDGIVKSLTPGTQAFKPVKL